ncbi:hypothetical protein D9619_004587 [Psilocybe cf. subviscida]|uniref:PITH domain-containing protein n=1 Tax=Psilocybe cf. subviscida TaxID=2480587 RepID=A0A8H5BQ98_9AGAR|nr:hypothetical protein D9619_004587 [Psilocybe cf. subviscida]
MLPTLSLMLATLASPALAATGGTFASGGKTEVSAMMMFLGNEEKVYILDKAEGNAALINGHAAWGAVWDIETHQATTMEVRSNVFCSSGMHLPNGSFIALGGNGAVGPGGNLGSQLNDGGYSASWDETYKDFDGTRAIRVLNPCKNSDAFASSQCQWFDEDTLLSMKKSRWYSTAEATGDGNVVIIGGFANGGYINRNYPNVDPATQGGAAESTYEYYPPVDADPTRFNFLVATSGLNAYPHTFLMPSGKMFVQANYSSVLWDHVNNVETPLPDMPGQVVRVYPASGATAMLPLTPENNYNPTVLFCGGSDLPEYAWGNYTFPFVNTWEHPASRSCQKITPEPTNGPATYEQDDDMLEGRTMGQFIILPNGKLLVVNGGLNGTAGYSQATLLTPSYNLMPYGESLASGPIGTPAIYDPKAPKGKRWSNAGFSSSTIPRLYHSSAILLPDASVLIAGSNPNVDVNLTTIFPTTYDAEIFYPPYFSSKTRPEPLGIPSTLSYGGSPFDLLIPASSYAGSANLAAGNTTVVIHRGGFTTHAMNMGQRLLQLKNTFTVNANGSITLHVSQLPPNANLFQPGPAFMFVNIYDVPSKGSYVLVGSGKIEKQPTSPASELPANVLLASAKGSGTLTGDSGATSPTATNSSGESNNTGSLIRIVGIAAGAVVLLLIVGIVLLRRRKAANAAAARSKRAPAYPLTSTGTDTPYGAASTTFVPLNHDNYSQSWNDSTASLNKPYRDDASMEQYSSYRCGHEAHDHDHDHDDPQNLGYQDNLYAHIDRPNVIALNAEGNAADVIKPWNERMDEAKSQMQTTNSPQCKLVLMTNNRIIRIPFTGTVRLKAILLKAGPAGHTPEKFALYANQPNLDFDDLGDGGKAPTQEFAVPQNRDVGEYAVKCNNRTAKFTNISHITLFVPRAQGEDTTRIYYIGFLGTWTEAKNQPIITVYEAQANLADHEKIQGMDGTWSAPGH